MSVVRIASTIVATFCGVAVSSWLIICVNASWLICPVLVVSASFTASRIVSKRSKSVSAGKGRVLAVSLNAVVSVAGGETSLLVTLILTGDDVVVGNSVVVGWLVVVVVVSDVVVVVVVSIFGALVDVCSWVVVVIGKVDSICAG